MATMAAATRARRLLNMVVYSVAAIVEVRAGGLFSPVTLRPASSSDDRQIRLHGVALDADQSACARPPRRAAGGNRLPPVGAGMQPGAQGLPRVS